MAGTRVISHGFRPATDDAGRRMEAAGYRWYQDGGGGRWVQTGAPAAPAPVAKVFARGGGSAPPRAGQVGALPPQDLASPDIGPARRRVRGLVVREPIAEVVLTHPTETQTTATAVVRVVVPDLSLLVGITLGFEPTANLNISSYASATWTGTLRRPASGQGREAELHSLWSSVSLPQGRAVSGLVGEIAISAAVKIPQSTEDDPAALGVPGLWVLEATFASTVPMCPEDLQELYAECGVRLQGSREILVIPLA